MDFSEQPNLARNAKNCDAVLRMAYKASDDGNGDGLIDKSEFPMMLEYVQYFNRMYGAFKEIDGSGDGMIDEVRSAIRLLDSA